MNTEKVESMYGNDADKNVSQLSNIKFEYVSADKAPYRFESLDDNAKSYLETNGYVVIGNILSSNELEKTYELLWKYLKTINWKKNDPSTWKDFPGYTDTGVIYKYGVGQSDLQWYIRTCPKVLEIFSKLWNVKDTELLTSFDGIGIFRPYDKNIEWKTKGQWFHVDQNPESKPNLDCYQGLISLYDQNEYSGGTVIIPKTHASFQEIFKNVPHKNKNLVQVPNNHWILEKNKLLICIKAGDLILWDSRTIHCNTPPLIDNISSDNNQQINQNEKINKDKNDKNDDNDDNKYNNDNNKDFLRLVSYVCMTPKSKSNEITIQKRISAYENLQTTNHMPHEFFAASSPDPDIFGKK